MDFVSHWRVGTYSDLYLVGVVGRNQHTGVAVRTTHLFN